MKQSIVNCVVLKELDGVGKRTILFFPLTDLNQWSFKGSSVPYRFLNSLDNKGSNYSNDGWPVTETVQCASIEEALKTWKERTEIKMEMEA